MKTFKLFFVTLLIIFVSLGCQKHSLVNQAPVVNPGADTSIQLHSSIDTVRLNGSATDVDGTIISYSWTQVSGPASAIIITAASASTNVTSIIAGVYTFQLAATDNLGAVGVKSIKVTLLAPRTFNTTLQPNNNLNEVKIAVLVGTGDVTDNLSPSLNADVWTINGNTISERSLFRFDIPLLKTPSQLISAKLSLYSNPTPIDGNLVDADFGTNNAMLLQRVTSSWDNNTKWPSQPSTDGTGQIVIPQSNLSRFDLIDIDVTSQVQSMIQIGNYGFMIKLQNESFYNSRQYCSSRYIDASRHPKLVLQFLN